MKPILDARAQRSRMLMKVLNEVARTDMLQLKIGDISSREHLADCSELIDIVRCIRHDSSVPPFRPYSNHFMRPDKQKNEESRTQSARLK
jgi:hypothetical protein